MVMSDNNVRESGLQGFWNRALSLFNKGKDEVVRSSKLSKARLDLSSLKKEKESVFERLGEEVYRRHKENKVSIPGLDSFFTEIDIINLKFSSKERELKGLKESEAGSPPADAGIGHERKERPYRPGRKGTHHLQRAVVEEVKTEGLGARPKKKFYRPKRRPSEGKPDIRVESNSNEMGL